jgi:CHASE2 domain-containing sensor protein
VGITDWLLRPLGWLFARHPDWRDAFGRLLLAAGVRFYVALALVVAAFGAWNLLSHPFDNQLAHDSFDLLMRQRPIAYRPDADVVVLDIDEASLAAMNAEYGRWPWPRKVLSSVAAPLEAARARAVVFDILFTDADVANLESEAAFDRYVRASRVSFFPAIRLNPKNDAASEVPVSLLNFASPDPEAPGIALNAHRTLAIMTPYFKSIYDSGRVGTSNIYPDSDNIVRWYSSFEPLAGYKIPSLPYKVAELLKWPLPKHAHNLINWPKGIAPYRTISFVRAMAAAKANDGAFFAQFAGKVVVVGSTAADLGDIKATPVDAQYPGVYVLATVLDNTKNDRYLKPLNPWLIFCLELALLMASALLFSRTNQALAIAKYFFIVPAVLFALSLASVSVSNWLVDLSVPAALVLAYFTFAKLFDANLRDFIAGTGPFLATAGEVTGRLQVACLPASEPRERVLQLLIDCRPVVKLWEPDAAGMGRRWRDQGWVLWRWAAAGAAGEEDAIPPSLPLCWVDVPGNTDASFPLAEALASAGRAMEKK